MLAVRCSCDIDVVDGRCLDDEYFLVAVLDAVIDESFPVVLGVRCWGTVADRLVLRVVGPPF